MVRIYLADHYINLTSVWKKGCLKIHFLFQPNKNSTNQPVALSLFPGIALSKSRV